MADEIRAQPRNQLLGLLGAIQDEQFRADVGGGLRDVLNRGLLGGLLGMPVDLATMAMRQLGYKTENPVGGSEWIGQKMQDAGLVSTKRNPVGEALAGLVDPATLAAGAIKAVPMAAGMFIGKGAKTWDALQAAKAMELEKSGTPARQIWSETGTWKGPDGKWRQEIPDNLATVGSRVQQDKTIADISGRAMFDKKGGYAQLHDVLNHDELYKAYPVSQDMAISFDGQLGGAYSKDTTGRGGMGSMQFGYESKGISTPMHEIQHAIQQREGFAPGGSPGAMPLILEDLAARKRQEARGLFDLSSRNDPLDPGAIVKPGARAKGLAAERQATDYESMRNQLAVGGQLDAYRRLAGEAEARATQARIPMDAAQRRATFPEDSYDVPMNALILRGLLAP